MHGPKTLYYPSGCMILDDAPQLLFCDISLKHLEDVIFTIYFREIGDLTLYPHRPSRIKSRVWCKKCSVG